MATLGGTSPTTIQEQLLAAEEERVRAHARHVRLEQKYQRRQRPTVETNVRVKLDQVYDIRPPSMKSFTPTKTHRSKKVNKNWTTGLHGAAKQGRREQLNKVIAEEEMNERRELLEQEEERRKSMTSMKSGETKEEEEKEKEKEKHAFESRGARKDEEKDDDEEEDDDEDDEDDYDDDDYDDDDEDFEDDFEQETATTLTEEKEEEEDNNNNDKETNRQAPRKGERVEAMLERLGWTEWFEGVVLAIHAGTEEYTILFDDGTFPFF